MKEKIIFATGINSNELRVSMTRHGINCINNRVCNGRELARIALMRSGIAIEGEILNFREECMVVAEIVNEIEYFGNASVSDIQAITFALRDLRHLVGLEEEKQVRETLSKGTFTDKNNAIADVFFAYLEKIDREGLTDEISMIRKAAMEAGVIDSEIIVVDEYTLTPLEKSLIESVSGGVVKHTTLGDLYGVSKHKPVSVSSYKNCYGASNEVETILTEIYEKTALDDCVIAVTDPTTYSQIFYEYCLQYKIPITFGCGIPIVNSNPAKLLSRYNYWTNGGFFGKQAFSDMVLSDAFDRTTFREIVQDNEETFSWKELIEYIGNLKLSNDIANNREKINNYKLALKKEGVFVNSDSKEFKELQRKNLYLPILEKVIVELSLPITEFVSKYSKIRTGKGSYIEQLCELLDRSALAVISDELKTIYNENISQAPSDIINNILQRMVCRQNSAAGKLHLTRVEDAASTMRKNLYIAGLSGLNYPGSPKENYLLLDSDIELFRERGEYLLSDRKIIKKRQHILDLVHLASDMETKINVSYAGMDVSELKHDNASSMIYELLKEERGLEVSVEEIDKSVTRVGYFDPKISVNKYIGKAYIEGKEIIPNNSNYDIPNPTSCDIDRAYSPSALDTFFSCPRLFMLKYVLGIPEPDEERPFEILSGADSGTMAHSLMEILGDTSMDKESFLNLSGEYFDRFIAEHQPLVRENIEAVREEFIDMMENSFSMDPQREIVLGEKDIHCTHESGIKIHGFPDRVERLDDGTCLIVDFKSGRRINHKENDINTCLQVVVYAYLMESLGYNVSGCEYRYIRLGEKISCKYDDEMKKQLAERLTIFRDYLEKGIFPLAEQVDEDNDPCNYCMFDRMCGRYNDEKGV